MEDILKKKKKKFQNYFLFYPPTINSICFIGKKMRFCLCIFESDTVKSDCPVQIFRKMMKYYKDLIQTVGVYLTSFTEILKKERKALNTKKALKMTSQLVIFRTFFSPPPLPSTITMQVLIIESITDAQKCPLPPFAMTIKATGS